MAETQWLLLAALALLVAAAVLALLLWFANRRFASAHALLAVWLAWFLGFSVILLVPVDIAASLYHKSHKGAQPPLVYVSPAAMYGIWRCFYWLSFFTTWFLVPILQTFVTCGYFSAKSKFYYALRFHVFYFTVLGIVALVAMIYILSVKHFDWDSFVAFFVAGSNAWGLAQALVFMGHGLVAVPVSLWYRASPKSHLLVLESKAPMLLEDLEDVEMDIRDISQRIKRVSSRIDSSHPLRPFINELVEKHALTNDTNAAVYDDDIPSPITESYLVKLHWKAKRLETMIHRCQKRWSRLLNEAWHLQDTISNTNNPKRIFESSLLVPQDTVIYRAKQQFFWWWYVIIQPALMRVMAVVFGVMSIMLLWSELTFRIHRPVISLYGVIFHLASSSYAWAQVVTLCFMAYMCLCAYYSLLKLKVFSIYAMLPYQNTDAATLLFVGGYMCKLMIPLVYNYLDLIVLSDATTSFARFMGIMNLVPFLGDEIQSWIPLLIILPVALTLLRASRFTSQTLGLSGYGWSDDADKDVNFSAASSIYAEEEMVVSDEVGEGRRLIAEMRKAAERRTTLPPAERSANPRRALAIAPIQVPAQGGHIWFDEESIRNTPRSISNSYLGLSPSPFPSPPRRKNSGYPIRM